MFKIAVNPTYTTQVKVDLPADNGKTVQRAFEAKFKRLTQTELDNIGERLQAKELNDDQLIDEVLVGWDGVADEDGNPLEFNPKNLAALLDVVPVRSTIVRTFFATIGGARTKN